MLSRPSLFVLLAFALCCVSEEQTQVLAADPPQRNHSNEPGSSDQLAIDLLECLTRNNLSLKRYDVGISVSKVKEQDEGEIEVIEVRKRIINPGIGSRQLVAYRFKSELTDANSKTRQRSSLRATIFGDQQPVYVFSTDNRRVLPAIASTTVPMTNGMPDFRYVGLGQFPRWSYKRETDESLLANRINMQSVRVIASLGSIIKLRISGEPYNSNRSIVILEWDFDLTNLMPIELRDFIGWDGKDDRKLLARDRFKWTQINGVCVPSQIMAERLDYPQDEQNRLLEPPNVSYNTYQFNWHSVNEVIDEAIFDHKAYDTVADFQELIDEGNLTEN